MFREDFIEMLACPKCKSSLKFIEAKNELICERCQVKYPIEDGILGLLPEKAMSLKDDVK